MEWAISILVFIGVIAVTLVIFTIWVIVTVISGIVRGIGSLLTRFGRPRPASIVHGIRCQNESCQAVNPSAARFCRRCGLALPEVQRVTARRAAIW